MARTVADIQKQIKELQTEADRLRKREVADVIQKIKSAIAAYDITADELFGGRGGKRAGKVMKAAARSSKYGDADGNVWGGRGPRPRWVREALAAGRVLDDLRIAADGAAPGSTADAAAAKPAKARKGTRKRARNGSAKKPRKAPARYSDGSNHWAGSGPRPGWLKTAIAAGKTLDELRVD